MSNVANRIEANIGGGKQSLIAYIVALEHSFDTTVQTMHTLSEHCGIIELGIPCSNPVADGAVIQAAAHAAISVRNPSMDDIFTIVAEFRKQNNGTAVVLMGYYNQVFAYGGQNFVLKCKQFGVDGIIICDLPLEEALSTQLIAMCKESGISFVQLLTKLTTQERMREMAKHSSGFVYFVGSLGSTGSGLAEPEEIRSQVEVARQIFAPVPTVVGFGINNPQQAAKFYTMCDGVVVGSHFIKHFNFNTKSQSALSVEAAKFAPNN